MRYKPYLILSVFSATLSLQAQQIQEQMMFQLVDTFDPADQIAMDAGDHTFDTNTDSPGLFQSIYGTISGNTISRAAFKSAVTSAYNSGTGGVIDFEDSNRSYAGGDWIHPDTGSTINREGADRMVAGGVTISRGPNWWFEGNEESPYRGKHEAAFDGTGPSGPDRANYDEIFFMKTETNGSRNEIGEKSLGQTTSFDLMFDAADQIGIIGFAGLNWNGNFQSQQHEQYAGYPNMHAIATFTNGVDTETQMAVGLTSMNDGNDYFFGFEGSDGYYLERLQFYAIGNNSRVFASIDDLGFVQVPEPGTYAAVFGLIATGFVLLRRRRTAGK